MKTVLLGITGGIAAVKLPELIALLRQASIDVIPMMTPSACRIIDSSRIASAAHHRVVTELFPESYNSNEVLRTRRVEHVEIADQAGLVVVAPATANIIGKLAHGIADDILSTTLLAVTCPIMIFPSMNVHMWNNPAVRENVSLLRRLGYIVREPSQGMLACGYEGVGRLPDVLAMKNDVIALLSKTDSLHGKTVIVTAGGTTEPIDDVRAITNRSSGKMGAAIADACCLRGASVIFLQSFSSVAPRFSMTHHTFITSADLYSLLRRHMPHAHIIFHAAAVADFIPRKHRGKMSSSQPMTLQLTPSKKILSTLKHMNPHAFIIGFKAGYEKNHDKLLTLAQQKLHESGADAIVANDISRPDRGFTVDTNELVIAVRDGSHCVISLDTKQAVAEKLLDYLLPILK